MDYRDSRAESMIRESEELRPVFEVEKGTLHCIYAVKLFGQMKVIKCIENMSVV